MNIQLLNNYIGKLGLNEKDVSKKCDIDCKIIEDLLNGKVNICTIETANKIVKGLDLPIDLANSIFFD